MKHMLSANGQVHCVKSPIDLSCISGAIPWIIRSKDQESQLCEILGFHSVVAEIASLLGCYTMLIGK
jgi:hypothetical protein